jgi:Uma2 family endonuclease
LVELVCDEYGIEFVDAGSMTNKRPDLEKGFEPDTSYYIQHATDVIDKKRIDTTLDPPPDLVIEINLSSTSMNKLPIYAAIGVPELWRYEGERVTIFHLVGDTYVADSQSNALPALTSDILARLVSRRLEITRAEWRRSVRAWVHRLEETIDSGGDE